MTPMSPPGEHFALSLLFCVGGVEIAAAAHHLATSSSYNCSFPDEGSLFGTDYLHLLLYAILLTVVWSMLNKV
jgi:hypothetical protein